MKIFISYSTKDSEVANKILEALESNGMSCFIAPRDIRAGYVYAEEIMNNLEQSDVMLLVLSNNSNNSQHVLREVERAVSNNIPIISYKIEQVELTSSMEYFLMPHQWMEADGENYDKLLDAVKEIGESKSNIVRNIATVTSSIEEIDAVKSAGKSKKVRQWKTVAITFIVAWVLTIVGMGTVFFLVNKSRNEATQGREVTDGNKKDIADSARDIKVGDTVVFGTYLSQPIEWRVVDIAEDGSYTLISSKVLCMKGFEGAQSGKVWYTISGETKSYDRPFDEIENMEAFGSNDWEKSSLRAWLNSEKENVVYIGQIPMAMVMCDSDNPYNTEPGFLNEFTSDEIAALLENDIETVYNNPDDGSSVIKVTKDLVYIPSKEDLDILLSADVSLFCVPTQEAIDNDGSTIYKYHSEIYGVSNSGWWLRSPLEDSYSELYCVTVGYNDDQYETNVAAVGGVGVRPMIRVNSSFFME